ncbi:MAG: ABC transporter substrate-binding protein [Dermatophilaceae bacterium]|nr:ABC transporter substrate-binding protein [Dermatophilaceae bacterium]
MRGNTVRARWATGVAGAACLALVLSACGGSSDKAASTPAANSAAIITAYGSEPQNPLLPANTNETGGGRIMRLLYEGLISYDGAGKTINQVAASIDTTDSQSYTIKLKPGWKFTNGEAVNAKSFVDAWNFGALITNAQLNAYFFEPIDGYKEVHPDAEGAKPTAKTMKGLAVVDESTFTVKLAGPQASFPLRLGYTAFYPLPQSAYKDIKAFGEAPVGNGSYMLDGKWVHNVNIKVKKNPGYKGTHVAKNGGVDVKVYTDPNAGYTDLQANNLDILDSIPDNALATFKTDLGDRAINQPSGVFQSFAFPLYQPEWKTANSKKVRQAISMAIDRKTITDKIFQGTRTPATDFSSPVVQGWSKDICGEFCTYDPAKAKALLAEAGGFPGKLEIAYNADGGHKAWVDATCNSIKNAIGIACSGKSYPDFKSLRDPITKVTMKTAFRTGWQMDYPALENFLAPIYAKGAGSNDAKYDNPAFDAMLKKGDAAKSPEASIKFFQDAEKILVTDMPVVPLWYSNTTGGFSEKVKNVKFDIFGVPIYTEITK